MNQLIVVALLGVCLVAANPIDNANTRIIGGTDVEKGTYPFIVALRKNNAAHCGGSIIHERWVLTAAHCVYGLQNDDIQVHAATNAKSEVGIVYYPELLIWNENFNWVSPGNDTGLVKISEDFDFSNPLINHLTLSFLYVPGGISLTAIGFGRTAAPQKDILQQLNMKSVPQLECRLLQYVLESELCVYNDENSGVCNGDSGSPIVLSGDTVQVGIASRVVGCAIGRPDIYTRVSAYQDWIIENIRNNM